MCLGLIGVGAVDLPSSTRSGSAVLALDGQPVSRAANIEVWHLGSALLQFLPGLLPDPWVEGGVLEAGVHLRKQDTLIHCAYTHQGGLRSCEAQCKTFLLGPYPSEAP